MNSYMIGRVEELKRNNKISFDTCGSLKHMPYQGTIGEVLETLQKGLKKCDSERDLIIFLYSNRLLSGLIDYGLTNHANILSLKHDVEKFCLKSYRGDYDESLSILQNLSLNKKIMDSPVVEKKDFISWHAFDTEIVEALIDKMQSRHERFDYLVLDGHDAYRPGFMVANAFNAKICAIRNSIDSKRDKEPRPLIDEKEYLRNELQDKKVLILGEDVSTGRAVNSLKGLVELVSYPHDIKTAGCILIPGANLQMPLDYFGVEKTCYQ